MPLTIRQLKIGCLHQRVNVSNFKHPLLLQNRYVIASFRRNHLSSGIHLVLVNYCRNCQKSGRWGGRCTEDILTPTSREFPALSFSGFHSPGWNIGADSARIIEDNSLSDASSKPRM